MIDLDEVRKLLDGVTPGPWEFHDNGYHSHPYITGPEEDYEFGSDAPVVAYTVGVNAEKDRRFIAAARELVPAMAQEIADLRAERDAALAGAVTVKPLVWDNDTLTYIDRETATEIPSSEHWDAETILALGRYSIMHMTDPRVRKKVEGYKIVIRGKQESHPTLEAAKAAAQADYEARIRAALIPVPDTLRQVREALEALCDAVCNTINSWGDPFDPVEEYEAGVSRMMKDMSDASAAARAALALLTKE